MLAGEANRYLKEMTILHFLFLLFFRGSSLLLFPIRESDTFDLHSPRTSDSLPARVCIQGRMLASASMSVFKFWR